jgi:hypothetical protein
MTPAFLLPEKTEPMERHIVSTEEIVLRGRASVCVRCSGGGEAALVLAVNL